jgi:alkylated DNA repair dioxygenase AlkB
MIPGLHYLPDYIGPARERELLDVIDRQLWLTELRRRVQHYGYRYDYKGRKVTPEMYLGPLPDWAGALAEELRARGLMPRLADQLIVNEYEPGQGIAPHVDCVPCFADTIASLGLGSSCVMEFTHVQTRERAGLFLPARSLVVLSGEARYDWRHAIPGRKSDPHEGRAVPRGRRVSLTFRNVLVERGSA